MADDGCVVHAAAVGQRTGAEVGAGRIGGFADVIEKREAPRRGGLVARVDVRADQPALGRRPVRLSQTVLADVPGFCTQN